jgi:uncharacterized phage protein gp47/JayE
MTASLNWTDVVELDREDVRQDTLGLMEDAGFPSTSWQPFSDALAHVELTADTRVDLSKIAVFFKKAFILETSTGVALTTLARSEYEVERNRASEAQGQILLTCDANNGPHSVDVGEITLTHRDTGQTYRNVEDGITVYPVTLGTSASVNLLFEAEVAGSAGNFANVASIDDIDFELTTTLAGVSVTSYSLSVSGVDEESDERLRERCNLKWARNLPKLGLIDEGVKASALEAAPGVATVAVDSTNPRGSGTFDVYIAGVDTTASSQDVSDVQLAIDVQTFGRNNTPKTCIVYAAPEQELDIEGVVYFTGAEAAVVQAAVEAALVAFIRSVPCGGFSYLPGPQHTVPLNDIENVIKVGVQSVADPKCTVQLDGTDMTVSLFGKVIRGDWDLTYQKMNA